MQEGWDSVTWSHPLAQARGNSPHFSPPELMMSSWYQGDTGKWHSPEEDPAAHWGSLDLVSRKRPLTHNSACLTFWDRNDEHRTAVGLSLWDAPSLFPCWGYCSGCSVQSRQPLFLGVCGPTSPELQPKGNLIPRQSLSPFTLACWYLVWRIYVHEIEWLLIFLSFVSLTRFGLNIVLASWNDLGSNLTFFFFLSSRRESVRLQWYLL